MYRPWMVLLFAVVGICSGCANPAKYVVRESNGGIVAIPSNSNTWPGYHRQRAEELMAQHYPQGYEIIREEEAVIGQTTTNMTSANTELRPSMFPFSTEERTDTINTMTTSNQTEYRIYYRPKGNSNQSAIVPTSGVTQESPKTLDVIPSSNAPPPKAMPNRTQFTDTMPGSKTVKPTMSPGGF